MSVTTTNNPVTGTVLQVLTDYDIHHSGDPERPAPAPAVTPRHPASQPVSNPASWPTEYNAIPPYRPINRQLDAEERPGGMNVPEQIFIFTMLNGVGINAAVNTLWRKTGGRINDKIFHYKIGGEK